MVGAASAGTGTVRMVSGSPAVTNPTRTAVVEIGTVGHGILQLDGSLWMVTGFGIFSSAKFDQSLGTTVGAAGMYMMTAEDIEYTDIAAANSYSNDEIGFELNGYLKYMLFTNVEFKINAGYLWAGDALDAFETGDDRDGNSDENIFGSSFRIRYKF